MREASADVADVAPFAPPSRTASREDADFLERYSRARDAQADKLFKECLEIADRGSESENENPQRIQRDRLRVDTRKWMAARLAPKKYGDRVEHDVRGGDVCLPRF